MTACAWKEPEAAARIPPPPDTVEPVRARTMLNDIRQPDAWFGLRYTMNLYRGCQHGCIYCDTRSECYRIGDLSRIRAKDNGPAVLRAELQRKRWLGTIGTGSMHDPYMPVERTRGLTRSALETIAEAGFPVHALTKSDLITRDTDVLQDLSRLYAAASFTVTTADDALAAKLEPLAPPPSCRFQAMRTLAENGILTGVLMMPILPLLEDTVENIEGIVRRAADSGARYIIAAFGLTLRAGSRDYFYAKLDEHFPGVRPLYEQAFGSQYVCNSKNAAELEYRFQEACRDRNLATRMPVFMPRPRQAVLL